MSLEAELEALERQLLGLLGMWKGLLQKARTLYYYLTYVHPQQLYVLHSYYFEPGSTLDFSAVQPILNFINPQYDVTTARERSTKRHFQDEELYDEDVGSADFDGAREEVESFDEEEEGADCILDDNSESGSVDSEDGGDIAKAETYLYEIGAKLDIVSNNNNNI